MTAMATTASFEGADVDGLDRLAQEFTQAAQVCDEVKAACEVIVAAASIFGPFGAAFVAYLKGVVIPWLSRISEALKLMSKVLSMHSQAQQSASSSATSLPSYVAPSAPALPPTSNYPVLPPAVGTGTGAASGSTPVGSVGSSGSTGSSSVSTPPAIGSHPATTGTPAAKPASQDPVVQELTALTNLVNALNHNGTAPPTPVTTTPVTTAPVTGVTDPGTASIGTGATGTTIGTLPGAGTGFLTALPGTGGAGSLPPGVTATPVTPGDSVGVLSVPVEISPDGHITPLLQTTTATSPPPVTTTPSPTAPVAHSPLTATPLATSSAAHALPIAHAATPLGGSGSGSGGATGGGPGGGIGGSGGGTAPAAIPAAHPTLGGTPVTTAHTIAAPHTISATHTTPPAAPLAAGGPAASHDGLYSGLGQATGIGAGAAALARATLHEARQRGDGGLLGVIASPFDADSDGAAQARIFDGELG